MKIAHVIFNNNFVYFLNIHVIYKDSPEFRGDTQANFGDTLQIVFATSNNIEQGFFLELPRTFYGCLHLLFISILWNINV